MDELIRILKAEELTCVVLQKQRLYKEHANGILPILHLLDQGQLQGAQLVDKVIGKAAALLMVRGEVRQVHACVISSHALEIFQQYNLPVTYDEQVPYIINRIKTGMCPMEACVMDVNDPELAEQLLRKKVTEMKSMQNA